MDDDRTQQTLDDLADLFLTGTGPAEEPRGDDVSPAPPTPAGGATTLEGPPPIKLRPKPALKPAPRRVSAPPASPEPSLRLTDYEPAPVDAPTPVVTPDAAPESEPSRFHAPPPTVEAVLLGNLPGMAGVWLTQYAQLLAQRDGTVALLYVDTDSPEGAIEAELVEPTSQAVLHEHGHERDAADIRQPLNLPPKAQRTFADVLEALARLSDEPLATVLVHTDSHPREVERLMDVGVWTLLTGSDETAIAAAGQVLESMVQADETAADASVGIFVMGAEEERAQHAAQRIISDTADLFDQSPEMLGYLQKMTPVALRDLGRFPRLTDRWAELCTWLQTWPDLDDELEHEDAAPAVFVEPTPAVKPDPHAGAEVEAEARPDPDIEATSDSSASPVVATPEAAPLTPQPTEPETSPQAKPEGVESEPATVAPAFAATVERTPPEQPTKRLAAFGDAPALVDALQTTHAAVEGLTSLQARCPAQPAIEFAVDGAGRLHLLGHHDSTQTADPPTGVLLQLRDADTWAREHHELLALTSPDRPLDADHSPTLHLFTDRADQAVPLAAKLGAAIKLHLLQPIELGGDAVWFCTPLSK